MIIYWKWVSWKVSSVVIYTRLFYDMEWLCPKSFSLNVVCIMKGHSHLSTFEIYDIWGIQSLKLTLWANLVR